MTLQEFKKYIQEDSWGKPLSKKELEHPFSLDLVRGYTKDKGRKERRALFGYDNDKENKSKTMHSDKEDQSVRRKV